MTDCSGDSDATVWSIVLNAAGGESADREAFALRYEAAVRRYLGRRWRSSALRGEIDDATQEVFVECFRQGGILERIREHRPDSFRKFLQGAVRNVALRFEQRAGIRSRREPRSEVDVDRVATDSVTASRVFDRAWAIAALRDAGRVHLATAEKSGERALRRVLLLKLRHVEGLPIRKIAGDWGVDAAMLHKEYATARNEFRAALRRVVRQHCPDATDAIVDERCQSLLGLLRA